MSDLDRALRPTAKLRLTAEILAFYAIVRLRLRRDGLPRAVDSLQRSGPERIEASGAARAARAVESVLRLLPTDSRCLVTSLVLIGVLARRGAAASLVIGVVPGPSFAAHAWVEFGGAPLLKPGDARDGRLVELR